MSVGRKNAQLRVYQDRRKPRKPTITIRPEEKFECTPCGNEVNGVTQDAVGGSVAPRPEKIGDEEEEEKSEGYDEEAVQPKRAKVEGMPSEEEVQDHNIAHLPFRSWCPHCVMEGRRVMRM